MIKNYILIIILILLKINIFYSEDFKFNNFGVGLSYSMNMSRILKDMKINIEVFSPTFINNIFSVKFTGSYGFIREIPKILSNTNTITMNYYGYKAGIVGYPNRQGDYIRPYGEFGFINNFHNETNQISTTNFSLGFYSTIGFNFLFNTNDIFYYFVEVGVIGMFYGNKAELILNEPEYLNGFIITSGIKYYF